MKVFLHCFLALAAPTSPSKSSEVESRLALYEAEFSANYETVVERTFQEQVRQLDLRYLQALDSNPLQSGYSNEK